jgi:hypothetical protein
VWAQGFEGCSEIDCNQTSPAKAGRKTNVYGAASQAAEKRRTCHPEPALFAGEGSAFRKKAKGKADSSPRSKTERVSE